MDWLDADDRASQPAKVRAVSQSHMGAQSKEQLDLQWTHMILTMQNTQASRLASSAIWHTFMGDAELVKEPMAATKKFAEKTRGQSGHRFGSPHVQAWRAWIHSTILRMEALNLDADQDKPALEALAHLKSHLADFEKATPAQGHMFVSQFRARLTKEQRGVVQYSLSNLLEPTARYKLDQAIHMILAKLEVEYKVGTAPPSECERKLQKAIDSMKESLKK